MSDLDTTIRAKIDDLETWMLNSGQTITHLLETIHHFAPGLYARELRIPKGTLLTGKIHRKAHLNIISQGDISVLTEQGPKRITAPHTMVAPPGTKRVGYAHEDTVWTTIHANETGETDPDKLEAILIAPSFEEFQLDTKETPCLLSQ